MQVNSTKMYREIDGDNLPTICIHSPIIKYVLPVLSVYARIDCDQCRYESLYAVD